MALVPAICTQCGAQIEVDNTQEAGICKHCGTAFVMEKAINLYTTQITNNNNFAGANVNVSVDNVEKYYSAARKALEAKDYSFAKQLFDKMVKEYPYDYRGWIGLVEADSEINAEVPYYYLEPERYIDRADGYKKAITLADAEGIGIIKKICDQYISRCKKISEDRQKVVRQTFPNFEAWKLFRKSNYLNKYKYSDETYYVEITIGTQAIMYSISGTKHYASIVNLDENGVLELKNEHSESGQEPGFFGDVCICHYDRENNKIGIKINKLTSGRGNHIIYFDIISKVKGCYVASCAYGSYDCPQVWTLRRFRDNVLDSTWYGRLFIKCYYAISPTLVKWFGDKKWFKTFCKKHLDVLVKKLNDEGVENTKYQDKY